VASANFVLPSPDGTSLFYVKTDNPAIFRVGKSGLNEELVYKPQDNSWFVPLLLFPGGKDLLAGALRRNLPIGRIFRISLASHEAVDLGDMPVGSGGDVAWAEPGNSIVLSRTVNGLTNIWKYSLQDRILTQVTFGTGPDYSPMPDPGGKGIYYVNGRSSGSLAAYHAHLKKKSRKPGAWVRSRQRIPDRQLGSRLCPRLRLRTADQLLRQNRTNPFHRPAAEVPLDPFDRGRGHRLQAFRLELQPVLLVSYLPALRDKPFPGGDRR
jgi:hypothetical protein